MIEILRVRQKRNRVKRPTEMRRSLKGQKLDEKR